MISPRRFIPAVLVLGVMGYGFLFVCGEAARAADVDAAKLIGNWVLTKANGAEGAIPMTYEFTKKGDVTYSFGRQTYKGTYKVKGDKLTLRFSAGGARGVTRSMTIKQLADDVLVILDQKNELEFKKK
jgi:uncharacterized protein (TIGR03066 family)